MQLKDCHWADTQNSMLFNICSKIYIKRIRHHDQAEIIHEMQTYLNIHKPINVIKYINRLKTQITWSSQRHSKSLWQNPTCLYNKSLENSGEEEKELNTLHAVYEKHTNFILNGKRIEAIPFKSRRNQACTMTTLLFNIVHKAWEEALGQEKELKKILIRKEEVKPSLFVNVIIL